MVHFDVKPDNLLVDGDWSTPNGPVVKVVSSRPAVSPPDRATHYLSSLRRSASTRRHSLLHCVPELFAACSQRPPSLRTSKPSAPNPTPHPPPPSPQADFGLSKHKYNTFCSNVHDLRGTLPYMAPEMIMDHTHVTEKADVWSLGVVFWEVRTAWAGAASLVCVCVCGRGAVILLGRGGWVGGARVDERVRPAC